MRARCRATGIRRWSSSTSAASPKTPRTRSSRSWRRSRTRSARVLSSRSTEFGGGSANKAINEQFGKDLLKAGAISLPLTLVILLLDVWGGCGRGNSAPACLDVGARGDRAPVAAEPPAADGRRGLGGRPADRTRGRRRLLDVLPQAEPRGARGGTDGVRLGRGCRCDVGPLSPDLGHNGDGGDVRDVHQRRQDLRGLRRCDDSRRRDFRPRLADRASGAAVQARGPRQQGPGAVSAQSRSARRREPLLGRDPWASPTAAARLSDLGSRRPDRARRAGAPPADDAEQHGGVTTVARRHQGLRQDPEGVPRRRDRGGGCRRGRRCPLGQRPKRDRGAEAPGARKWRNVPADRGRRQSSRHGRLGLDPDRRQRHQLGLEVRCPHAPRRPRAGDGGEPSRRRPPALAG